MIPGLDYDEKWELIIAETSHDKITVKLDASTRAYIETLSAELLMAFKKDLLMDK